MMMRLFAMPLSLFGLNAIATATLAGVIVSLLGTLAAMIALYEFASVEMDEASGIRAAFYLLIFPSGFFLAEIYTEGLFVGLAFSSLATAPAWTSRLGGSDWRSWPPLRAQWAVTLAIPLLISWINEGEWLELDMEWKQLYYRGIPWRIVAQWTSRGITHIGFLSLANFLLWAGIQPRGR